MHGSIENCPALVLNADFRPLSYFPLSLWSWQDAVKAVFLNRVNIVSEYDRVVRSPNLEMRLPSVISLKEYIPTSRRPAFTRFNVFLRDRFMCKYCGEGFPVHDLTFDHIVPRSRGGRTVWEYAAHSSALKAGVSFYGPPEDAPNPLWPKSPTQLAPEMKAPVLGLYGEADTGIPVATVEALKEALAKANKPAEFKIYPAAPHGFHADYRPSYRKDAAEDGWNQMQAWFRKYKVLG